MKSIDEITGALGFPEGTWDGISDCLASITQNPPLFVEKGLLNKQCLTDCFDVDTLRAHQIYLLQPDEQLMIDQPGQYIVFGGNVIQNHPEAEGWYFGDTKAEIWQSVAHGFDRSHIDFYNSKSQGDVHNQATANSNGSYIQLKAFDDAHVEFRGTGTLDLYDRAIGKCHNRNAYVNTYGQSHLIAKDVFRIRGGGQSFIEAHDDCRVELSEQAACVAYGQVKVQAREQNTVWMMHEDGCPLLAAAEAIVCKAYEAPEFREAIHQAVMSDRTVPALISRLIDLTLAYGPAIEEHWDYGLDGAWLAEAKLTENRNFANVPKDWAQYDNILPTVDRYDNLEIRVDVQDEYCETSSLLDNRLEKRGFLLDYDPHQGSYATFKHWGNAKLFQDTVRYEEAVLHKVRPVVQLHETEPTQAAKQTHATHRSM